MDASQSKLMAVLAALLLVLTVLVTQWRPDERPSDATEPIWSLEADDVTAVTLRGDETVSLERVGEEWRVMAPYEASADEQRMRELLDSLREIDWGTPVEGAGDATEFGLAPPRASLEVRTRGGGVYRLEAGDDARVGYQMYARAPSGTIVTVRGTHAAVFSQPARAWRDHRVFRFDPALVRRVVIDGPEGVLDVSGKGTEWWLKGFTRADPAAVDALVYGLLDIRVADFLVDAEPIEERTFLVSVHLEDGTVERSEVGTQEAGGIRIDLPAGLAAVAIPQTLTLLVQGPTDLGDAHAFVVEPERTERLRISSSEHSWEVARNGDEWLREGVPSADAHGILGSLDAARIHYRREPVPTFEEPWVSVETWTGDRTVRVEVGPLLEGSWHVARDAAGGQSFLIPVEDLGFIDGLGPAFSP